METIEQRNRGGLPVEEDTKKCLHLGVAQYKRIRIRRRGVRDAEVRVEMKVRTFGVERKMGRGICATQAGLSIRSVVEAKPEGDGDRPGCLAPHCLGVDALDTGGLGQCTAQVDGIGEP